MSTTPLEWLLLAHDEASPVFEKMSKAVDKTRGKLQGLKVGAGILSGVALTGMIAFAKGSSDAFTESEIAQTKLQDAFKRFPKLADTNIEKLNAINEAIEAKTGVEHTSIESGQAVLAQFGLTGAQLEKLTPLMVDYAARTGVDVTEAAKKLGLALEGNQRGLKNVGIMLPVLGSAGRSLKVAQDALAASTNNVANKQRALADIEEVDRGRKKLTIAQQIQLRNAHEELTKALAKQKDAQYNATAAQKSFEASGSRVDQMTQALQTHLGGYAETVGGTAAGKTKILNAEWNTMQQQIGSVLVPVLTMLVTVGARVLAWLNRCPTTVKILGIVLAVLVGAILAVNAALWATQANPIVLLIELIIAAIVLLVITIIYLATHWNQVWAQVQKVFNTVVAWITARGEAFSHWWTSLWGTVGNWIKSVWQGFTSWVSSTWNNFLNGIRVGLSILSALWKFGWQEIGTFLSNIWNNHIVAPIRSAWNWIVSAVHTGLSTISSVWNNVWAGIGSVVRNIWNGIVGFVEGGVNRVIGVINGIIGAVNSVTSIVGVKLGKMPSLPHHAAGTAYSQGGPAVVGENGPEIVDIPMGTRVYSHGTGPSSQYTRWHPDDLRLFAKLLAAEIQRGAEHTVLAALNG